MSTIKDFLRKGKQKTKEETELERALEISKQDHLNEQKKLLEQFEKLSKKPIIKPTRKRKIVHEEVEDDWFQTISSKPQKKQMKQEKQEDVFEFDLTSIFNNSDEQDNNNNNNNNNNNESSKFFDNSTLVVSDAESECSVIDLCDEHTNQTDFTQEPPEDLCNQHTNQTEPIQLDNQHTNQTEPIQLQEEEEDDGYLSPLEGFVSLKDSASSGNYFAQLEPKPTRKRKATTPKPSKPKKKSYFKRSYWKKKKK